MIAKHDANANPAARLSNWLTVQAAEVAGDFARYKRASHEAHSAYLSAGRRLVSARGECRRGEWSIFLQACGVEPRTGRNMMTLARAGVTADDVTAAGGVRAAIERLRAAAAGAVEAAAGAVEAGEKTETVSGFSGVPVPPVGGSAGESAAVPGDAPVAPVGVSEGAPGGGPGTRAGDDGLCRCGRERAPGRRQCGRCLSRDRDRTRERLAGGRYAAALDRRLREAGAAGRGLSLSAGDVARLLRGGGAPKERKQRDKGI